MITSNNLGQQLGSKGRLTRGRLVEAAERLLAAQSPIDLTATAIAREAQVSAATFYVYFNDVQDLLLALSAEAGPSVADLFPSEDVLAVPERLAQDAARFITQFNAAWDAHAAILLYRNLEADRGNAPFDLLRTASARPILNRLVSAISALSAGRSDPDDAFAEAVVLFAAVERIAATTHRTPENGPRPEALLNALARLLARSMLGHAEPPASKEENTTASRRKLHAISRA